MFSSFVSLIPFSSNSLKLLRNTSQLTLTFHDPSTPTYRWIPIRMHSYRSLIWDATRRLASRRFFVFSHLLGLRAPSPCLSHHSSYCLEMAERLQALSTAAITQYLAQYHQAQAAMAAFQQSQFGHLNGLSGAFNAGLGTNFGGNLQAGAGAGLGGLPTTVEELAFLNNFLVKLGEQIASGDYYNSNANATAASTFTGPNPFVANPALSVGVGFDPLANLGIPMPSANPTFTHSHSHTQSSSFANPAPPDFSAYPNLFPTQSHPLASASSSHSNSAGSSSSPPLDHAGYYTHQSHASMGSGVGAVRRSMSGTPEFDDIYTASTNGTQGHRGSISGPSGSATLKRSSDMEEERGKRSRLDIPASDLNAEFHSGSQQQQRPAHASRRSPSSSSSHSHHSPIDPASVSNDFGSSSRNVSLASGVPDAIRREHVPRLGTYELGMSNGFDVEMSALMGSLGGHGQQRPAIVHAVPKLQANLWDMEKEKDEDTPNGAAEERMDVDTPKEEKSEQQAGFPVSDARSPSVSSTSSYSSLGDGSLKLPALQNVLASPTTTLTPLSHRRLSSSTSTTASVSPNATPRSSVRHMLNATDDEESAIEEDEEDEDSKQVKLPGISSLFAMADRHTTQSHHHQSRGSLDHITGDLKSIALRSAPGTPQMSHLSSPALSSQAVSPRLSDSASITSSLKLPDAATITSEQRQAHADMIEKLLGLVKAELARRTGEDVGKSPKIVSNRDIPRSSSPMSDSDSDSESDEASGRQPSRYRRLSRSSYPSLDVSGYRQEPVVKEEDEDQYSSARLIDDEDEQDSASDSDEEEAQPYVPGSLYPDLRPTPMLRRIYAQ